MTSFSGVMQMRIVVPLLVGIAALVVACRESVSDLPSYSQSPPPLVGGAMPPYYVEPLQITVGDYLPSDFPLEELSERGLAAVEAEKDKPKFNGIVGDFRLYSFDMAFNDPAIERKRCVVSEFRAVGQLQLAYLPPGTSAATPWYTGYCTDGSMALVMREFLTKHGRFSVAYQGGERAFGHDAPAERISAQTINGRTGVVVRPILDEGFGRLWIAVGTPNGFIVVEAVDLPLAEGIKIAEGVTCDAC